MSSTPGLPDPRQLPLDLSALHEVFLGFGTEDQGTTTTSRTFAQSLQSRRVHVVSVEVQGQDHVWPVWRQVLADFLQTLFT